MSIKSSIADYLKIDELKDNFLKLIEAKFELKKLEVQEKFENVLTDLIVAVVLGIAIFVVFIFINILIAIGLNLLLKSTWMGYAIVLFFYVFGAVILNNNKQWIREIVRKKVDEKIKETGI
jgi:uncharacterized membrane protein YqjE